MDYSIAAKPTKYAGYMFRSRLEAKWAAFFDLVGWRWSYEPEDLYGWVPDFYLHGHSEIVAVEVKPIWKLDQLEPAQRQKFSLSRWPGDILVLGSNGPSEPEYMGCNSFQSILGWIHECEHDHPWDNAAKDQSTYVHAKGEPKSELYFDTATLGLVGGHYDFWHTNNCYHGRMTGLYDGDHYLGGVTGEGTISALWAEAHNRTAWNPKNGGGA
jgi:hypothetical protein